MLLWKTKKERDLFKMLIDKSLISKKNLILKSMSIVNKNKFDNKKTSFRFSERFCFN